jgi:hypothetical protein
VDKLRTLLNACKKQYDQGGSPFSDTGKVALHALNKLKKSATARHQAMCGQKSYSVFSANSTLSRPFLPSLFIADPDDFNKQWEELELALKPVDRCIGAEVAKINAPLYTALTAFCVCYDLWKPSSRKTPGTFLEVLLGAVMGRLLPNFQRAKTIPIPNSSESVSTDLVFTSPDGKRGLVIPAKITTRERIVQPFAHQRILDSVFGVGRYHSVLLCVSEMQRDEDANVNEICVPGPIRLYQSHLAQMSGIYYIDPPARYLQTDVTGVLPVGDWGTFFTTVLPMLTAAPVESASKQ